MEWKTLNFDWNRARAFLVAAEEGTFSAAARALNTTQPTIGRQVSTLEEELGVALFERVGNQLVLTNTGVNLLEYFREMGEAATRISLSATGQASEIEGSVSVTAGEAVAAFLLPPVISRVRQDHPGIDIEVVASNDVRDLHRREADIAIRNIAPKQSDLIAKKMGSANGRLYASHEYLQSVEITKTLDQIHFLGFDRTDSLMSGLNAAGLQTVRSQYPIVSSNHLVQWSYCLAGLGACVMLEAIGDAEPRVSRVLPNFKIPVDMWIVCHRELRTSRRIRLVFDEIVSHLSF